MSTLTEVFGTGNNTYFSNRLITQLSFLRTQNAVLEDASIDPTSKCLTFDSLNRLVSKKGDFAYPRYENVREVIGRDEKTLLMELNPSQPPPALVFLGLDWEEGSLEEGEASGVKLGTYAGTAYFALDVSSVPAFKEEQSELGNQFKETGIDLTLSQPASSILSQSRSLLDRNKRNLSCSYCGGKSISIHGGAKVIRSN